MTDPWCCYLFGNMDPINTPQINVSIYTSTMDPSWDIESNFLAYKVTLTALVGHVWQARAHHSLNDGHGVRRQGDAGWSSKP